MKKVLVIAVHPDDETLGAGGTILRHKYDGDEVNWLIITRANKKMNTSERIDSRNIEIEKVVQAFEYNHVYKFDIDSQEVEESSIGGLIKRISDVVIKVKPDIMYLPFYGDVHSEHKYIFQAAFSCTKSFRFPFVKEVYMMEVLSETNFGIPIPSETFIPNYFVDISSFLGKKLEIMRIYQSEMQLHPFPRSEKSIVSLACLRGSQAGVENAEAFMCLKNVR